MICIEGRASRGAPWAKGFPILAEAVAVGTVQERPRSDAHDGLVLSSAGMNSRTFERVLAVVW